MAFDRAAAKQAGYTDEEIDAYLQANPEVAKETPPAPAGKDEPPPPSTVIPEIPRYAEGAATAGALAAELAPYALGAYGVYELGKTARNVITNRMGSGAVPPTTPEGSPIQENKGPVKPSGQARTVPITEPRSPILNAQGQPITRAPAAGAGAVAPEAQAAAQAAKAAAPAAEAGGLLSRISPYLETAGKVAGPAARILGRVAGPVGLAATAYEAYPYLQQAEIGPRTASGEVGKMVKGANRMALNMPTPAPLSAQEARNLLDSGDERTINIYGGRQRLMSIANPNALNSGYAQQLNRLGR